MKLPDHSPRCACSASTLPTHRLCADQEGRTTMPMMSIETVKKAERLIQERTRIAAAKWNAVTYEGSALSAQAAGQA